MAPITVFRPLRRAERLHPVDSRRGGLTRFDVVQVASWILGRLDARCLPIKQAFSWRRTIISTSVEVTFSDRASRS